LEGQLISTAGLYLGEKLNYLHSEVVLGPANLVRVDLTGSEANVKVMDDYNFRQYKSGGQHKYFGGHYRQSPAVIRTPSSGLWHVTVDTGGFSGRVNARISVV
jgi:hypothetical protein